jgi:hypothetical protein
VSDDNPRPLHTHRRDRLLQAGLSVQHPSSARAAPTPRHVPVSPIRDDENGAAAVRAINDGNEISPTVLVNQQWLTNPPAKAVIRAIHHTASDT